jgi:hypothetical protein
MLEQLIFGRWESSVPQNEDSLGLESVLGLDNVFNEVLSVMGNLCPHVIDEEGLGEVVFIVREGHGLEVKGHHSTALYIAKLVAAGCGVGVNVEELGHGSSVLGEVWVLAALVPLLIVIDNVIRLRSEQLAKTLVLKNSVEQVDLINGWLSTLVSDAGKGSEGKETEVDLPDKSLVEHKE